MEFSILFAGYMFLAISGKTIALTVGSAVSALIAFALKFLFFHVDYMRTERVQFEDDEYYYYVKGGSEDLGDPVQKTGEKICGKNIRSGSCAKRAHNKRTACKRYGY